MKEDTVKPFLIGNNRYAFYDVFIHRTGNIVAIAPLYKEQCVSWENIRCHIGDSIISPNVTKDPHGHTVIMNFTPPHDLGSVCDVTFTILDTDHMFTCAIDRSRDTPKYCVAATQLKNCAAYVKTWMRYHMSIGVEHFYFYDNNSSDHLKDALDGFPATYIHWPFPYGIAKNSGLSGQTCAQNHALYRYDHAFVALTDVDEYIYSPTSSLLRELHKVDITTHSGILMCCQWFGCAHGAEYDTENFLEKLVYRKEKAQTSRPGHGPKCIVHPPNIDIFSVHRPSKGKSVVHLSPDVLRFNHYYTLTIRAYNGWKSRKVHCSCETHDATHDEGIATYWNRVKDKKPFVFISVPKNGSQSVFSMLGYKIKDRSSESDHGIMDNHARAVVLRDRYRDFDSRFTFCFVRNPLERLVSWYDHHLKVYRCEPYKSKTFKEWVMAGCPHHWKKQNGTHWNEPLSPIHQWQFLYDADGNCLVDRIYRMESFDAHFEDACRIIGVEPPERKTHKNKATKGSWKDRYDDESLAFATKIVEKDIRLFGY